MGGGVITAGQRQKAGKARSAVVSPPWPSAATQSITVSSPGAGGGWKGRGQLCSSYLRPQGNPECSPPGLPRILPEQACVVVLPPSSLLAVSGDAHSSFFQSALCLQTRGKSCLPFSCPQPWNATAPVPFIVHGQEWEDRTEGM